MGYCTVDDVRALRPQLTISASSKPSTSDIQRVIDQISGHIDGIMAAENLMVPLVEATSPISFKYVQACVMWGVAGMAEDQQRAAVAGGPGGQEVRNDYYDQYLKCIEKISEDPGILVDTPQQPGTNVKQIQSFFTENPTDDPNQGLLAQMRGTSAEPRFSIRQEF